jgi:AraC-like DNA-binding protein
MDFYERADPPAAAPIPEVLAVQEDRTERLRMGPGSPISSDALSVYLRGGPRYRLGQRVYHFRPPVAILVPKGMLDCDLQQGKVQGYFVLFKGQGLLRADPGSAGMVDLSVRNTRASVPVLKRISMEDAISIVDLLREIAAISADDVIGQLQRSSRLLAAIVAYCRARNVSGRPGAHREAARLKDLLDRHALQKMPLSELYAQLNLSTTHAAAVFRKAFGFTPVVYRTRVRLRRARELLISSRLNVSETARAVGFEDPLYLSRVFHRAYGRTPSSLIYDFRGTRK